MSQRGAQRGRGRSQGPLSSTLSIIAALCQDQLTPHQKLKMQELDPTVDSHLKAPAGAGKTFVAIHRVKLLLRQDRTAKVLYVSPHKALGLWFIQWLRAQGMEDALVRVHVLFEPFHQGPWQSDAGEAGLKPSGKTMYTLVVVDEAHTIYADAGIRASVETYTDPAVSEKPVKLLLSDASQSMQELVQFPRIEKQVVLTEVINKCVKQSID